MEHPPTPHPTGAATPAGEPRPAPAPAPDIVAVSCPRCGGALTLPGGARVVTCPSCGGRSLLALQPPRPVYYLEPAMDASAATAAVRTFLRRPPSAPDLAAKATLLPPHLHFVPYHQVTGRRVGIVHRQIADTVLEQPQQLLDARGQARQRGLGDPAGMGSRVRIVNREDTKVMIADVQAFIPAFGGRRWDLADFDAAEARLGAVLRPADLDALQRRGTVLSTTVPMEGAEARLVQPGPGVRIVAVQRRTLLFPFWLVPVRYRGARFEALVSAVVDGSVVWATTPGDRGAPPPLWLLATAAGFLGGVGGRGLLATAGVHFGAGPPAAVSALLLAVGGATAVHVARRARTLRSPTWHWRGASAIADGES